MKKNSLKKVMWNINSETTKITLGVNTPEVDPMLLGTQWKNWYDKLNTMNPNQSVGAIKVWSKLLRDSLEVEVYNN